MTTQPPVAPETDWDRLCDLADAYLARAESAEAALARVQEELDEHRAHYVDPAAYAELRAGVEALADEWDTHSDRLYDEARGADRDAEIVLRSKSGTYAVNAERLRDALDADTTGGAS
jgi:hypothetical protein